MTQTASEGKLLTNGDTFATVVYLGEGASEWEEVDDIGQLKPVEDGM
jgi:hypothetical protein